MPRCLVLGANGFIGSHLVDSLANIGHDVRAFDRFSADRTNFNKSSNVTVVKGDFLNRGDLSKAIAGSDYVFHFISTTTPATSEDDPLVDIDTNIRMSIELFALCIEHNVKRVIFSSTGGAIYGKGNDYAHKETDIALPVSPYAIGKLTIEHYLRYFRVKHGLDSVVFRISNPYGERQPLHRRQGVIPVFLENICQKRPIILYGDGTMVRDYVYVKDVASMITSVFDDSFKFDTYNLGSGRGLSLSDLIDKIAELTDQNPKIENLPVPPTFIDKVILDTTRFRNEFNQQAQTPLEVGLKSTLNYIQRELKKV